MLRYHRSHVLQSSLFPFSALCATSAIVIAACSSPRAGEARSRPPPRPRLPRQLRPLRRFALYVTNETSATFTVIDAGTQDGRRHRAARQASARHSGEPRSQSLYVALSGSPPARLAWTRNAAAPDRAADGSAR